METQYVWGFYFVVLGLQGALMGVDEFYYHVRRGLPRWERLGHPLDTSTVLLFLVGLLVLKSESWPVVLILGVFSSLFITKDEWIHHRECLAFEQWIHSILFVIHPMLLGVLGGLWWFEVDRSFFSSLVRIQFFLTSAFGLYQVVYWNWLRPKKLSGANSHE